MPLLSDQISATELSVVLAKLRQTINQNVHGDIVEFGCYVGTTSVHIQPLALAAHKTFHVYDSFEGLPQKAAQDESPAGTDFIKGELSASKKTFITNFKKHNLPLPVIHKGWFSDLAARDLPGHISFAFLDGDFYESILDSLRLVWPRLDKSGLVLVHDYQRVTLPGVERAIRQFLSEQPSAKLAGSQEHVAILHHQHAV